MYQDNIIDIKDVPTIIILIKDIYKKFIITNHFSNHIKNITIEDSIDFIKNILFILIELEELKVKNKDDVIFMINISIELLTTTIDIQESLFHKLKKCFNCCNKKKNESI